MFNLSGSAIFFIFWRSRAQDDGFLCLTLDFCEGKMGNGRWELLKL